MIPTLIGVTAVVFFVMAMAPGGFSQQQNEGGGADAGADARRTRQATINRYGLDKPVPVQYLRWLNQVSPIGFKMSGDHQWPEEVQADVLGQLGEREWAGNEGSRRQYRDMILLIAAYAGESPQAVFDAFDRVVADPVAAGPALFDWVDGEPIEPDLFWPTVADKAEEAGGVAGFDYIIRELQFTTSGKSRVVFSRMKLGIDLGESRTSKQPVLDDIGNCIGVTLGMNLIAVPIIYIISIISGVRAANKPGGLFDTVSGSVMLMLFSVPAIWAGTLLIGYFANVIHFKWFPAAGLHDLQASEMPFLPRWGGAGFERGYLLDMGWHFVLPIICMVYGGFAFLTKVMRGSVLDTINADFVRTARAKGIPHRQVLYRHVLRNSLLPMITMAAAILPGLFVGSFVVETIFSIEGMGKLTLEAAKNKDIDLVMGATLIGAVLSLSSLLLRDILYAIADPRVSYE